MRNLIIADDHVVVRQAISEMLTSKGDFKIVAQAANGQELLNLLETHSPDLVIMDMEMPELTGIQALERMSERNPDAAHRVPILVLSADESPLSVRNAIKAGAKGYVPKNAGSEELQFAIKAILEGKTYLSPSVTEGLVGNSGHGVNGESPISVLSKREVEILAHLANGKPNREIGVLLGISTRTVDTHRSNILKKLKKKTNAELVKLAIGCGLISV
jgi:DNA-binding NarL/FixJ family response regulator